MEISWKLLLCSSSLLSLEAVVKGAFITHLVFVGFPPILELSYFLYACAFAMKRLHDMNCLHLGKPSKI